MDFWSFLKPTPGKSRAKPATVADLKEALVAAGLEAASTEQAAADIAQERAGMLLSATDDALDAIDRKLQLAQRAADKAAAAVAALRDRLAEAEAREAAAVTDRLYADGKAALAAGLKLYGDYQRLALNWPR